ncbi:MAG: MFS transporter [Coriobacteriales bacterium]|jgi:MFS family permease|nr:MFS transporter [Coriobacteriales bacterium]
MNTTFKKSGKVWALFIGCCVMSAVGFSIATTTFSLFVTPISESMGIPTASVFLYYTTESVGVIIATALTPQILKKAGAGKTVAIAAAVGALGLAGIAAFASPVTIPLFAFIIGLALPLNSLIAVGIFVNNWFLEKTGFFTGLAFACSGIGGAILSAVASLIIQSFGWQFALYVLAAIMFLAIAPFGIFVIRLSPLPLGILPYGATEEKMAEMAAADTDDGVKGATAAVVLPGLTFKEARRSSAFFILVGAFLLFGVVGALNTNVATLVRSGGYAITLAGLAVSIASIGNLLGKILMGWVKDHKGGVAASAVGIALTAVGLVLYIVSIFIQSVILVYIAAFIGGMGSCLITILPPLLTGETFGRKDFAQIFGIASVFVSVGSMIATPIFGAIFDTTKSYLANCVIMLVVAVLSFPLVIAAIKAGQSKWLQSTPPSKAGEE